MRTIIARKTAVRLALMSPANVCTWSALPTQKGRLHPLKYHKNILLSYFAATPIYWAIAAAQRSPSMAADTMHCITSPFDRK